jgi:hypothetical protein
MSRLGQLFFLLLAANLLAALWFLLRSDARPQEVGGPLESSITLVQEMPPQPAVVVPLASVPPPSCYILGDFDSEDAARAAMDGVSQSYQILVRQIAVEELARYRVRSEIAASPEDAAQRLSQLREAISRAAVNIDSYLVTTGTLANSVSLGLFAEQANALNVQRILSAQGEEIIVEKENPLQNRYQLLFVDDYLIEIGEEKWLEAGLEIGLAEPSQNLCETIAQAQ